jgi:ribonuclease HI
MIELTVYTDGACSFNGDAKRSNMGVGIRAVCTSSGEVKDVSKTMGNGSSNIAELLAIKIGLLTARELAEKVMIEYPRYGNSIRVVVYCDSLYAIGCVTNASWKPRVNQALIAEIKTLIKDQFTKVEFVHVRGHAGHVGNEIVDKLAKQAATTPFTPENIVPQNYKNFMKEIKKK